MPARIRYSSRTLQPAPVQIMRRTRCRSYLHQRRKFSYPLLLASFHYGLDYVEARDFDLDRLDPPDNPIYRELWRGNLTPEPPPKAQIPR